MKLDILSIGDELLIGQTLNTNAHWIAKELNRVGFVIREQTTISDSRRHILDALKNALLHSDVVLITGGLGPTNDDLTMPVLNEYFGGTLVLDEVVLEHIKKMVAARGFEMNDNNRKQAMVPDNCKVVFNKNGTAPGLWFEKKGKVVVAMPGVPYEMRAMVSELVIPKLKEAYELPEIVHQMVYTQGVVESVLAEKLVSWEENLPPSIKLAYLPSPGRVKLRLTSIGKDREEVIRAISVEVEGLYRLIPEHIYSMKEESLEEVIGEFLRKKGATVSTAESCTGGYIAHLLTRHPGSSDYYKGSVIAYSNEVKEGELQVDANVITNKGAVSEEVVRQMAENVRLKLNTDYAIAVSGIAGPDGGTKEKPVGTVWIAVATKEAVIAKKHLFGADRKINIEKTAVSALGLLKSVLVSV